MGNLQFPLFSDLTKQISRDYGMLLEDSGVALRVTVLIDPEGVVRSLTLNDLAVDRGIDETLWLLRAFPTGGSRPITGSPARQRSVADVAHHEVGCGLSSFLSSVRPSR
jgi:peroxiredoxin (alkyl hydroperoxide reductase subunit C)